MNIWIKTILNQLLGEPGDKPTHQQLSFTRKCMQQMKDWNLSEEDITDVFRHGELMNENMLVRKYNGYEIGMYYFRDKKTGSYIVSALWKGDRR